MSDQSVLGGKSASLKEDSLALRSSLKTPARGGSVVTPTLETVAENSAPDASSVMPPPELPTVPSSQDDADVSNSASPEVTRSQATTASGESESDHGAAQINGDNVVKADDGESNHPSPRLAKKSYTNLAPSKGKVVEPPIRGMTVETETVSSVPQAPLNAAVERGSSGKLDANGTIRLKASNELMRPKKEKKRNMRRPTSINTGTSKLLLSPLVPSWPHANPKLVSSKADIFEARVATAVDEANSSDSDETFVYESNPPEAFIPRSVRHHSRTPSATSVASQADQLGGRSKANGKDGQHSIAGKRSMKFANYNTNLDGDYGSQSGGRGAGRTVSTPRHHHISRHSRGPSHTGLFDNESPFTQPNRPASPRVLLGRARPNSPRFGVGRIASSPRKSEGYGYDVDDGAADDEGMPLIGSVRVNRSRHSRRPNSGSIRQMEYMGVERRDCFARYGAFFLVTFLFLIMCVGGGTLIGALSRSLLKVSIVGIENVVASEQELMFDVNVRATNPNLFALAISELNVDIFAKSGFAGTAAEWREGESRPHALQSRRWGTREAEDQVADRTVGHAEGVDEGNDPIDDPESDPQIMVLGRVYQFDSPLLFESSPFRRQPMVSLGEIRLTQPGNKTEEGGSARWERVIQHRFELIIGGVIKYQLPLSSKMRSAAVRSRIMVHPDDPRGARPSDLPASPTSLPS
jgi:hypothetical protein